MNVQWSEIQELMFYEIEQSHNALEATKNTYCEKVDPWTVTRWFKKFCSGLQSS